MALIPLSAESSILWITTFPCFLGYSLRSNKQFNNEGDLILGIFSYLLMSLQLRPSMANSTYSEFIWNSFGVCFPVHFFFFCEINFDPNFPLSLPFFSTHLTILLECCSLIVEFERMADGEIPQGSLECLDS